MFEKLDKMMVALLIGVIVVVFSTVSWTFSAIANEEYFIFFWIVMALVAVVLKIVEVMTDEEE